MGTLIRRHFRSAASSLQPLAAAALTAMLGLAACGGGGDAVAPTDVDRESPQWIPCTGGLFVSPAGNDANPGTQASPKRSIAAAAALLAGTCKTVWLLDGTYAAAGQGASAASIPSGVNLAAVHALQAVVQIRLDLQGNSRLRDLAFRDVRPAITASSGAQLFTELRFSETVAADYMPAALDIGGSAQAKLVAASAAFDFVDVGMRKLARVHGQGSLTIEGGNIDGMYGGDWTGASPQNGTLVVVDEGRLELVGTRLLGDALTAAMAKPPRCAIWAEGTPQIILRGSEISGITPGDELSSGICVYGAVTLDVLDGSLIRNAWPGIRLDGTGGQSTVRVENSEFLQPWGGIELRGDTAYDLKIADSKFSHYDFVALLLKSTAPMKVDIRRTSFVSGSGDWAIEHAANGSPISFYARLDFRMRGSTLLNDGGGGLKLAGTAGGVLDLGMPGGRGGGNTIRIEQSNGLCNLRIVKNPFLSGSALVHAVGNTWLPNSQGSNVFGRYNALGAGAVWDVAGPTGGCPVNGNYELASNVTLRLDRNP
jgi:hypothetical protein